MLCTYELSEMKGEEKVFVVSSLMLVSSYSRMHTPLRREYDDRGMGTNDDEYTNDAKPR